MLSFVTLSNFFLGVGVLAIVCFLLKITISYFMNKKNVSSNVEEQKINFLSAESIFSFFIGFGFIGFAFKAVFYMPVWMCFFAGIMFGLLFSCLYAFILMNVSKFAQNKPEPSEENAQE